MATRLRNPVPEWVPLACPRCAGELLASDKAYTCQACQRKYAIRQGVPIFLAEPPYYGELSQAEMGALLREIESRPWREVVYEYLGERNPWAHYIITEETRADWQYFFELDKGCLVLDVGAGWGTCSVPLASRARVVAMDSTWERGAFIRRRCELDKVNDVAVICGDILEVPFPKEVFDLVTLNGVLEWVGTAREDSSPAELQKDALVKAYRILKPGGQLYIGIENRYGFKYLLGAPDDHTGIRDIAYLPRKEADDLSRLLRNRDYRTYTHSRSGYATLLKEAGFTLVDFWYPIPDYKTLAMIVPLSGERELAFAHDYMLSRSTPGTIDEQVRVLERVALEAGTVAEHVASCMIVAQK